MRIVENYTGGQLTYSFDPGYDIKVFYQEIVVPRDDYEVKLVSMFAKNTNSFFYRDLDMTDAPQYIKIDWNDGVIFKTPGTVVVDSGCFNSGTGSIIQHTFKKAGTYLVKITSVEDLVVVDSNFSYENNSQSGSMFVELKTKKIGGKINRYIPPEASLNESIAGYIRSAVSRSIRYKEEPSIIHNGLTIDKANPDQSVLFRCSWILSVEDFEGMYSPLEFKYTTNSDWSFFFCRWQSRSNVTEDTICNDLDDTLYNMFRNKNFRLDLTGMFAHAKGVLKAARNGDIGEMLKDYAFEFTDYTLEYVDDIVTSYKYLFWNVITSRDTVFDAFKNDMKYWGLNKLISKYPDILKGAFGMMSDMKLSVPFNFSMLLTKPEDGTKDEGSISGSLDMSYFMFGTKARLAPVVGINKLKFFKPETKVFTIDLHRAFMASFKDSVEEYTLYSSGFSTNDDIGYIPIPGKHNVLNKKIDSVTIDASEMFYGLHRDSLCMDLYKFMNNSDNLSCSHISLFYDKENIDNPIVKAGSVGTYNIDLSRAMVLYDNFMPLCMKVSSTEYSSNAISLSLYGINTEKYTLDRNIVINQKYTGLFKCNTSWLNDRPNPLIYVYSNMGTQADFMNIFLDLHRVILHSTSTFTNTIDYTSMFENVSLDTYFNVNTSIIQPIGYRFINTIKSIEGIDINQYNTDKYVTNINLDRVAYNSDVVTKEIVMNSFASFKPNATIEKVANKKIYYNKETVTTPKINSIVKAFMNDSSVITDSIRLGRRDSTGNSYRDRSVYRETRVNGGYDSYYGLKILSLIFNSEMNYTNGCSMVDMFKNNISFVMTDSLPHNDNFTLHVDKHDMTGMFSIDSSIGMSVDKNNVWKYSEFKGNDTSNLLYTIAEAKYAYLFDDFRIFKTDHLDINKLDIIDNFKSLKVSNIFKGRIFSIEPVYGILLFNRNMVYNNKYFINSIDHNYGSYAEGFHLNIPTKLLNEVNDYIGATGGVISRFTDNSDLIDYTPGYVHNVFNVYDDVSTDMTLKMFARDNTFSVCNNNDTDVMNKISDYYVTTYGDRSKFNYIIKVDGRTLTGFHINQTAGKDGWKTFLTSESKNITALNSGNIIYECRTYVSLNRLQSFPLMKVVHNNDDVDSSLLSSMVVSNDINAVADRAISMNNVSILSNESYSYLSSLCGALAYNVIPRCGNKIEFLNGYKNNNKFLAHRDFLDYFYNMTWMNKENDKHLVQHINSDLNEIEVIRSNDLKFIAYFKVGEYISFGGENLKTIDVNGLIHNDYIVPGMYMSRNNELFEFGSENMYALKLVLGSMVHVPGDPGVERCTNTKNDTLTPRTMLFNQCFRVFSNITVDYFDPSFFSNISSLNSNIDKVVTILYAFRTMYGFYPRNNDAYVGMFKGNVIGGMDSIWGPVAINSDYKMPSNLDDMTKDDINIYVSNHKINPNDINDSYVPRNLAGTLKNIILKPSSIDAHVGKGITIRTCRAIAGYFENNGLTLNGTEYLTYFGSEPTSSYGNPFIIKIIDDRNTFDPDYNGSPVYVNGGVLQVYTKYDYTNKLTNKFIKAFGNGFVESFGSDNSVAIATPFEYEYHYLNRFIFNKLSSTTLSFKDIVETVFDNGNSYGIHIKGFIINKNCTLKYTVDGVDKVVNYEHGGVIELDVMLNNKVDKTLEKIEITNITSEHDDLLTIDIKVGIRKDIFVTNQERFKPRIFVKDNNSNYFEMQRLFFKKKPDVTGNWNINIHKSNLTRDIRAREVMSASYYNGEILFTDNLYSITHRLERGYLNNNSLGFNIDAAKDSYVLYCLNDTPFSCENSDGEVYKIEGPLVYDLSKFNIFTNGVMDLSYVLRSLCNTNSVAYVDPKLFANFNLDKTFNTPFKVTMGMFHISNIDLRLFNPFEDLLTGIKDSYNNKDIFSTVRGHLRTNSEFSIENSFNLKLSTIGLLSTSPFILSNLVSVLSSFNFDNASINKIIPNGFLDSKQTNSLDILSSFSNCVIMSPLKNKGVDINKALNLRVNGSFTNCIYEDLFNRYGDYILNYILNYSKQVQCTDLGTIVPATYSEISAMLDNIQTNINNDLVGNLESMDIEDARVHTKMYIDYQEVLND